MKNILKIAGSLLLVFVALFISDYMNNESYDYSKVVKAPVIPDKIEIEESQDNQNFPDIYNIDITDHTYDQKYMVSDDYSLADASIDCKKKYLDYGHQSDTECRVLYDDETNEMNGYEFRYTGNQTTD